MSRGVHAVQHEMEHKIQHDEDHGGGLGGISVANKRMALVIAVLALFLAFAETAGKSAQTTALNAQIEASNLWNFFQAKNVRRSSNVIAAEQATLNLTGITDPNQRAATEKQIAEWTATAERYRSEPSAADGKGEGTEELRVRAVESAPSSPSIFATRCSRSTTTMSSHQPGSR